MSLSDVLIIASIIAGLTSVPFVASTITSDYGPTGNIIFGIDNSSSIPSEFTRSMSSGRLEQTFQTPFGRLKIIIESDRVYQELSRPDKKTIVEQTPEKTEWKLITQDYTLTITKNGYKITDEFASPDGYIKKIREMGNITETVSGPPDIEEKYEEAKEILNRDIEKINEIMENHMNIPGEEKTYNVTINEILPDPNEDYNHDNETDSDDEFIELYNYGDSGVDVSSWVIKDEGSGNLVIPNGTTLGSKELILFIKGDKDGDYGSEWYGTWPFLNNGGDSVKLYNENGELIDSFSYNTSTKGESWSRIPDGTGDFQETNPTPGELNE